MPGAVLEDRLGDRFGHPEVLRQCRSRSHGQGGGRPTPKFRGWCCMSSGGCPRRCALPDGTLRQRDRGTPQGSAVSPVLANLFMHYAFDAWMVREYPNLRFERYADDVVVHCVTERQARNLVAAIGDRVGTGRAATASRQDESGVLPSREPPTRLRAHGVYVLGVHFSFPCSTHEKNGAMFVAFQPAISKDAPEQDQRSDPPMAAAPLDRAHPGRHRPTDQPCRARLDAVLRSVLPLRAVSTPVAHQCLRDALDPQQVQTAAHHQESQGMLAAHHPPTSPALGRIGHGCTVPGGKDDTSPVTRDCHAGICGSRRVKPPPATRRLYVFQAAAPVHVALDGTRR